MWTLETKSFSTLSTLGASLLIDDVPMTFGDVIQEWGSNDAFRAFWISLLQNIPFEAYCWEMPPLIRAALTNPFECVFVESPTLKNVEADPAPFAEHFHKKGDVGSTVFENLGRDAVLVAPYPEHEQSVYAHLAKFVRNAPHRQTNEIWQLVAETLKKRTGATPVWLNTAGLGVYWLHIRLDSRPKYYRHQPYISSDFWNT